MAIGGHAPAATALSFLGLRCMRASVPLISKCLNSSLSRVSERVLDPASPQIEAVLRGWPKLVKVDLAKNKVVKTISFDESIALAWV